MAAAAGGGAEVCSDVAAVAGGSAQPWARNKASFSAPYCHNGRAAQGSRLQPLGSEQTLNGILRNSQWETQFAVPSGRPRRR